MSKGKKSIIYYVFNIYNRLFDYIEKEIRKLRRKRVSWKVEFREALKAAREKLIDYYSKTQSSVGYLYD